MKIVLASENSVIVYFGDTISPDLPAKIAQAVRHIKAQLGDWIIDLTPAYTSLLISYRLNLVDYHQFCQQLEQCLLDITDSHEVVEPKLITIPVYYHSEVGLDLARLLEEKQLSLEAFIELHSATQYLVYAIGFSPNFAFLGEVDARIRSPRLDTPRIQIPAGSVGIANKQTAVYPANSSGGWNIVGRTPLDLSLKQTNNPYQFSTGDHVKFQAISRSQYLNQGGML